jgi:predicted Zn-dependent peptidase
MRSLIIITLFTLLLASTPAYSEFTAQSSALNEMASRVKLVRLSNGLRVLFYRRDVAPVFSGVVAARVGGSDESMGETGISHMFEHMAFKGTTRVGTKDYPSEKKLLEKLEELVAQTDEATVFTPAQKQEWDRLKSELQKIWQSESYSREYEKRGSSGLNATTDTDLTQYFVSLPRAAFEYWCQMESERLLEPVMRQFYEERDVVNEERRMRYEDDPQGRLYELLIASAFRVHPYRNPVIGYPFDVSHLTAAMLDSFRRRYYVPSNVVLALVGDVSAEQDAPLVEKYFGRLPVGPAPSRTRALEPKQEGERVVNLAAQAAPEVMIAYHKPNYPNPDDVPISVMLQILAGSRVSPLYTELVKRKQLATSVSHSEAPGDAYPNLIMFQMVPKRPHSNQELIEGFDQVLRKFQREAVKPSDLEMAKREISMDYLHGLDSNMGLALVLVGAEATYNDWQKIFSWYEQMLKLTPQDIQRVAAEFLKTSNRTVAKLESTKQAK